jgi:hypothetical protein
MKRTDSPELMARLTTLTTDYLNLLEEMKLLRAVADAQRATLERIANGVLVCTWCGEPEPDHEPDCPVRIAADAIANEAEP